MRKGQRVRVLRTGELGTVVDKRLNRIGGTVRVYCKVKLDNSPQVDRWLFDDELGATKETCTVTLKSGDGREMVMHVETQHEPKAGEQGIKVSLEAGNRPCLLEHKGGLHFLLAAMLMKALAGEDNEE